MLNRTTTFQHRTLHLVDADNLTGGPTEDGCVAQRAADTYRISSGTRIGDQTIVGSDLRSAAVTAFAWPGVMVIRTTGTDAVDHSLIEQLDPADVAARFGRVVVGSGDGIFADAMNVLRDAGVAVEVVAPRGGVSHRLYPASRRVSTVAIPSACSHGGCRLPVRRSSVQLAA